MSRAVGFCPECGREYEPAIVACPACRVALVAERADREAGASPEVVHRVPDVAAGALISGMLEHNGIRAVLRSATLPAYGLVGRDWSTSSWGEIVVRGDEAAEARALISEYLQALERGGAVRDEDVEEAQD